MREMMEVESRDEQRKRKTYSLTMSVQLHCHLTNLINEIFAGDVSKLSEFQQMIQYAPDGMRMEMLEKIQQKSV